MGQVGDISFRPPQVLRWQPLYDLDDTHASIAEIRGPLSVNKDATPYEADKYVRVSPRSFSVKVRQVAHINDQCVSGRVDRTIGRGNLNRQVGSLWIYFTK